MTWWGKIITGLLLGGIVLYFIIMFAKGMKEGIGKSENRNSTQKGRGPINVDFTKLPAELQKKWIDFESKKKKSN